MKKIAMAIVLALLMMPAASFAQVTIRIAPPRSMHERPGPRPDRESVWLGGYHRYDGDHYTWTPGHYERPPHPGAHWVANKYEHRNGGYVFVEGHWR